MIDHSISFCTDKNFEIEEAHRFIQSVLENTNCEDIHLVTPDPSWARKEFKYPFLTMNERKNPIPEHRHSHKLSALDVSDKAFRIFADTRVIFLDSLDSILEKMEEDILIDQVFCRQWPDEEIWRKWFDHFDLELPEKKFEVRNQTGESIMRHAGFIIVKENYDFSEYWIDTALELKNNFPEDFYSEHALGGYLSGDMYGPLFHLDQIALTIVIKRLNMRDDLLPEEIETWPPGGREGKIVCKDFRGGIYKPDILKTPFGYLSWDGEEARGPTENMSYEDQTWKPFFREVEKDFTFLDIGAGIGYYSLIADEKGASKVIAIDKSKQRCQHLRAGESLNRTNWNIRNIELGKKQNLDSLSLESPDLVKIDVEGDEWSIIEGGKETLKEADRILLETHQLQGLSLGETEAKLKKFLNELDFEIYREIDQYRTMNSHWFVRYNGN